MPDKEEQAEDIFERLIQVVTELGWDVAIPDSGDDDAPVKGLIIGQSDYIDTILKHLPEGLFDGKEEKKKG